MRSFTVSSRDDGVRLNRYVEKVAPGLTQSGLYKALRKKSIKVNGRKCEASDRLCEGDEVRMWLPDDCFPKVDKRPDFMGASRELDILYEDESIAVLFKPVGLNSHPVKGEYTDNLISRFLRHLYESGEYSPAEGVFTPALCNRLDRNTAGIVLAGKTRQSVEAVNRLIRDDLIEKRYRAVCVLSPPEDGIYKAYHFKKEDNTVNIADKPKEGYKEIITEFRTLKNSNGLSYLEVTLHTGRTHQIRAHLAHLGSPILGDPKYGLRRQNEKYKAKTQYLTAYSLTFRPTEDSPLSYLKDLTVSLKEEPYAEMFR